MKQEFITNDIRQYLGIPDGERIPEYNMAEKLPLILSVINLNEKSVLQFNHHLAFFRIIKDKKVQAMLNEVFPDLADWFDINAIGTISEKAVGVMCLDNSEIAGFVHARQEGRINGPEGTKKWVFSILGVNPKYQGKGVGGLMIQTLKEEILNQGGESIFARTDPSRIDTVRFYLKHGFQVDGNVGHYYYGPSPAVWMWCDLLKK